MHRRPNENACGMGAPFPSRHAWRADQFILEKQSVSKLTAAWIRVARGKKQVSLGLREEEAFYESGEISDESDHALSTERPQGHLSAKHCFLRANETTAWRQQRRRGCVAWAVCFPHHTAFLSSIQNQQVDSARRKLARFAWTFAWSKQFVQQQHRSRKISRRGEESNQPQFLSVCVAFPIQRMDTPRCSGLSRTSFQTNKHACVCVCACVLFSFLLQKDERIALDPNLTIPLHLPPT